MAIACLPQTLYTSPQIFFFLTRKCSVFKSFEDKNSRNTRKKVIIKKVKRNIVSNVVFNFWRLNGSLLNLDYIILQWFFKKRRQQRSLKGHGLCRDYHWLRGQQIMWLSIIWFWCIAPLGVWIGKKLIEQMWSPILQV